MAYRGGVRGHLWKGCGRVHALSGQSRAGRSTENCNLTTSALCGSITTVDLWPHTGRCAIGLSEHYGSMGITLVLVRHMLCVQKRVCTARL
jgi:hypothetical protein